jgi:hypothetical protein
MLIAMLALAAQSSFTVTNAAYAGPVVRPPGTRLVWNDEFNGRRLHRFGRLARQPAA